MTHKENLLMILSEECIETAIDISKAIRFGLNHTHPEKLKTNRELIMAEYAEILGAMEMLQEEDILPEVDRALVEAKKVRILKFTALSESIGTLKECRDCR